MTVQPQFIAWFSDYIEREIGIVYSEANRYQLEMRLEKIAKQMGLESVEALWKKAQSGVSGPFRQLLLDVATNNETSFFRDQAMFDVLGRAVLPRLAEHAQANRGDVRIWSAASSTGQEAYSLSILVEELFGGTPMAPRFSIIGTDIADTVLKKASTGLYSAQEVARGISQERLKAFFVKRDGATDALRTGAEDLWEIRPNIATRVRFQGLNLLHDWPGLPVFDLILCRNVLIYQSVENKRAVLRRIAEHMRPNGVLILGAAESLIGLSDAFEQDTQHGALTYRLKADAGQARAALGKKVG